jgi:hypothetical protein
MQLRSSPPAPRCCRLHSPPALPLTPPLPQVFCLLHKMDLIAEEQRDLVFSHKEQEIKASSSAANVSCFKTSIWDETLCVHPPVASRLMLPSLLYTCDARGQVQGVESDRVLPHPQRGPA